MDLEVQAKPEAEDSAELERLEVERLARLICAELGDAPDEMVPGPCPKWYSGPRSHWGLMPNWTFYTVAVRAIYRDRIERRKASGG